MAAMYSSATALQPSFRQFAVCALLMRLIPSGWLEWCKATERENMQSVIVSVAVGLLTFAMGVVGLYFKRRLPHKK